MSTKKRSSSLSQKIIADPHMINLLLVDEHNLICQGLKAMLTLEPDLRVIGTADNGKTAIEQVATLQPDVVIMDVRMPVMDGIEATRIITQQFPNVNVLILSTSDDAQCIAQSLYAGAKGYLLRDMPSEDLAMAIRLIHRGYSQIAPRLLEKVIASIADSDVVNPPAQQVRQELTLMTSRQRDVLYLISLGSTNREIAKQLYIAEGTVKTHVNNLFNLLNLRNRSQLAIYANSVFRNRC